MQHLAFILHKNICVPLSDAKRNLNNSQVAAFKMLSDRATIPKENILLDSFQLSCFGMHRIFPVAFYFFRLYGHWQCYLNCTGSDCSVSTTHSRISAFPEAHLVMYLSPEKLIGRKNTMINFQSATAEASYKCSILGNTCLGEAR